jgi:hypothetical protein
MSDLLSQLERAASWIDAYYDDTRRFPVLSRALPGELRAALPISKT